MFFNDQVQIVDYQEDRDNREEESAQRSRNEVQLNSVEQRQIDQLFGDADQEAKEEEEEEEELAEEVSSSNDYQQEHNLIAKRFEEATGGLKIPPAPKSKVVPKFDFDDCSGADDSEEEIKPKQKPGAFDFGMGLSDDEEPAILPARPIKAKGRDLLQS